MATIQHRNETTSSHRSEWVFSIAFFVSILTLFLISFTGRSAFGDGVKTLLTVLSAVAGGVGVAGGLVILLRSVREPDSRVVRIVVGGLVTFVGAYTVIHVLN